MTDPYRGSTYDVPADAPRDPGIVGDVIAQFADPKAFYRELVQNSIDAGSPSVQIELHYDDSAHKLRIAVRDRGEGMTRDVVENQLLVLFRSTKEQDRTKIGKFGIGFVSVLAPNPEVVIVTTARDQRRVALHLYRDLSYELFDAGPASQNGTTVELEVTLAPEQVAEFVRDSELSLLRWCRHASVPIEFTVHVLGEVATRRIDTPLALTDAIVEVRRTTDDGQLTAVVGIGTAQMPYVGFFNHGLTLYETTSPLVGNVAAKIQDARLGHTISRDDVRRDKHFERAIEFARTLAEVDLPRAVASELRAAAEAGDDTRYAALADAIVLAELELPMASWWFPLVEPFGGRHAIAATELGTRVWVSMHSSPVTAALTTQGTPVLRGSGESLLLATLRYAVSEVHTELTLITPVDGTDADVALLAALEQVLDVAHRPPTSIMIAKLDGARADRLAVAGTGSLQHVVDREEAGRDPFAFLRRRVLVLSAEHPHMRAARRGDPVVAASHLARAVLLEHGLLDEDRSQAILDHVLERVESE